MLTLPGPSFASAEPLPAWFEPNTGQYDARVKFFSVGGSGTLLVKQQELVLEARGTALRIRFVGASSEAPIEGADGLQVAGSRFIGNDASRWRQGMRLFGKVRSRDVYPGVDVLHYLTPRNELEFDFAVAPTADPRTIRLRHEGGGDPRLDDNGDLVFKNGFRQRHPVAYQETPRGRTLVEARYRLARNGEVSFAVGRYDRALPLVIDPVLHAGYVGGDRDDNATAIARDQLGNVWITGSGTSVIGADNEPIQAENKGGRDVFVARLSPTSSGKLALTYWTQLGGSGDEEARAIAIDPSGMICVTGSTSSTDFPEAGVAIQADPGGDLDAFVVRIDPNAFGLDGLRYSQVYGGAGTDVANALAVDAAGAMYIAGYTTSDTITGIVEQQAVQSTRRGGYDAFFAKIAPDSESPLVYATFLGGSRTDAVTAIALAAQDQVYLTGYTASDDFPVTFDAYDGAPHSIFFVKLDIRKTWLDGFEYATYLGGESYDQVKAMAIDSEGMIWLAGYTLSTAFPVTFNGYQVSNRGSSDVFALRFNYGMRSIPGAIAYSTYAGGSDDDVLYGMAMLPGGRIALVGYTYSKDFPVADAPAVSTNAAYLPGAFALIVNTAQIGNQALIYSTVFDGAYTDVATGVVNDGSNLLICGFTTSFDFPVNDTSTKLSPGGLRSSFVVKAGPGAN